jgi:hypothetical protein
LRNFSIARRLYDRGLAAAQNGIALKERALVNCRRLEPVLLAHLPTLAVDRERILIGDQADLIVGDATPSGFAVFGSQAESTIIRSVPNRRTRANMRSAVILECG